MYSLGVVNVEKVTVQSGLEQTSNPGDPVNVVVRYVAVNPVDKIQRPVDTECKEIVSRDSFGLARTLKHEQLGQNRDGFEPDRERP